MFGFFKRTKIEKWEIDLLYNVLHSLPEESYRILESQIEQHLHRGVLTGISNIPGYVGLTFNPEVYKKFYDKKGRNFKLSNIYVFDEIGEEFLTFDIYVSSGVINGYSITKNKYKIDIAKIDVSKFRKIYLDDIDYNQISSILTPEEKDKINPSEVFSVEFNGNIYYHLKDIEDGDFIGIDINKKIYKLTHDPFEAVLIRKNLVDVLGDFGDRNENDYIGS